MLGRQHIALTQHAHLHATVSMCDHVESPVYAFVVAGLACAVSVDRRTRHGIRQGQASSAPPADAVLPLAVTVHCTGFGFPT